MNLKVRRTDSKVNQPSIIKDLDGRLLMLNATVLIFDFINLDKDLVDILSLSLQGGDKMSEQDANQANSLNIEWRKD